MTGACGAPYVAKPLADADRAMADCLSYTLFLLLALGVESDLPSQPARREIEAPAGRTRVDGLQGRRLQQQQRRTEGKRLRAPVVHIPVVHIKDTSR